MWRVIQLEMIPQYNSVGMWYRLSSERLSAVSIRLNGDPERMFLHCRSYWWILKNWQGSGLLWNRVLYIPVTADWRSAFCTLDCNTNNSAAAEMLLSDQPAWRKHSPVCNRYLHDLTPVFSGNIGKCKFLRGIYSGYFGPWNGFDWKLEPRSCEASSKTRRRQVPFPYAMTE